MDIGSETGGLTGTEGYRLGTETVAKLFWVLEWEPDQNQVLIF